jgi:hypothetical protein
MKYFVKTLSLALFSLFLFSACDLENKDEVIKDGHAKVNVFLIDAPADYDEVWVEVLAVQILSKGVEESNESAWINLPYEKNDQKINLLSLTGGNSEYLGEVEVPAGAISQIRLLLGEDNYIMQNGKRLDLKTPSAQQSGLKLKVDKPLSAGVSYDLVIDFDASKSIVKAGNSGLFILKPVLRVVAEELATVEGTVLPLEAGPVRVSAILDQDTVGAFTDENGLFVLRGLKGGTYNFWFVPNTEDFDDFLLEDMSLTAGETTKLEVVTLEEAVEEEVESEEEDEG